MPGRSTMYVVTSKAGGFVIDEVLERIGIITGSASDGVAKAVC